MTRPVDGVALGAVGVGSLFLYAGVTGRHLPAELQALVKGQSPGSAPAGGSPFGSGGSGGKSGGKGTGQVLAPAGYVNPLSGVKGLVAERVDQGVDYSGTGPVYAIGPGKIVATFNPGWPGGGWIVIHLSAGTGQGRYWYTAENIAAVVSPGDHVTAGQHIGNMNGGIETGWAAPPGTGVTMAMVHLQWNGSGNPTAYGKNASDLLASLGCPPGTYSGPVQGTVPAGWLK